MERRMEVTKETYEEVLGLYVNLRVLHKYFGGRDEDSYTPDEKRDVESIRKGITFNFDRLDKLKVPFSIQNTVISEARKKDNYNRYNDEVLNKFLKVSSI